MQLTALLERTQYTLIRGSGDIDITGVVYDSRKAGPGSLFIAINGFRTDSHNFLPKVAEQGAAAVVIEKNWSELPAVTRRVLSDADITVVKAGNGREALALLSAAWFGYPTERLTVIGMTGTKGKTTSTHMLMAILEAAGKKAGMIGTNGIRVLDEHFTTKNTTPEPYDIQRYAAYMLEKGCEYMVMEVSSTGIKYHRADGIDFDYGVYTNLSPDHIGPDEHPDFADYLASKAKLFTRCRVGIFNRDDEHFPEIYAGHSCQAVSFGVGEKPFTEGVTDDYAVTELSYENRGGSLGTQIRTANGRLNFYVGMPGLFNVYNALSAAVTADLLGIPAEAVREGLAGVRVNGRMEVVLRGDFTALVDYAHNGVSARTLLETLRAYDPARLVVVFGCGGNRDPHRRNEMGEASGKYADLSIVTADNSRFESVESIMKDIHIGLDPTGGKSVDIPDRREAIRYAIKHAEKGDIIAVIGKGHEDYQEVEGVRHHFLDREEIENAAKEFGVG